MHAVLGIKTEQTQKFLTDGTRIPVTVISVPDNIIAQVKTQETERYSAIQLGIGTKKKPTKALVGHMKKANQDIAPLFLREMRLSDSQADTLPQAGEFLKAIDVLAVGDIVKVSGTSKGKGFAGGVKRYGFRGGPRTHGQSDRERAPGSIGQTTTPGRVYKGKKMAGRMGSDTVTVSNLVVVGLNDAEKTVYVKGLIPGNIGGLVILEKTGEVPEKKFNPLFEEKAKDDEQIAEPVEAVEEQKVSEDTPSAPDEPEKADEKQEVTAEVEAEAKTESVDEQEETAKDTKKEADNAEDK